ncbi:MAG: presenilin family intramembrane aspartyl protease PSH [Thermoplasmata archaeon]
MKSISMVLLFFTYLNVVLLSILLSILFYPVSYGSLGNQTNNPGLAVYYFLIIIAFTFLMIFLMRKKMEIIIKGIYYFVVGLIIFLITGIILSYILTNENIILLISIFLGVVVPVYVWIRPGWMAIDILGLLISAGAAAIIGTTLGIIPIILLLLILIFYDLFAVKISKHMISLAEGSIKTGIPALFIFPDEEKVIVRDIYEDGKKSAVFMGFGDAAIPSTLLVSSLVNYTIYSAILTFIGLMLGLFILFYFMGKGKPLPGLPFLNTGALAGFLLSILMGYI